MRYVWLAILLVNFIGLVDGTVAFALPQNSLNAFVYPVVGTKLASKFGARSHPVLRYRKHHNGIDLAAPDGSIIRAIAAGRVVFADPYAGFGNLVVIMHENGLTSHYGHCRSIRVQPGATIKAGQILGTVGHTGMVTGSHLHFEIRLNGKPQDPQKYLPGLTADAQG